MICVSGVLNIEDWFNNDLPKLKVPEKNKYVFLVDLFLLGFSLASVTHRNRRSMQEQECCWHLASLCTRCFPFRPSSHLLTRGTKVCQLLMTTGHFSSNSGVMSEKLNCLVQDYTQVRGSVCLVSCGLRNGLGISWNLSFTEKFLDFFPCILLGAPYSLNNIFVAFFCETHRGLDGHVFTFVLPIESLWTEFNPRRMTLVIACDKFCRSMRLSWRLLSSRFTECFSSLCTVNAQFSLPC